MKTEIRINKDGTFDKRSLARVEAINTIEKELAVFDSNPDYILIKEKTISGYIPRKHILVNRKIDDELIVVDIPSFEGSKYYKRKIYKKTK